MTSEFPTHMASNAEMFLFDDVIMCIFMTGISVLENMYLILKWTPGTFHWEEILHTALHLAEHADRMNYLH